MPPRFDAPVAITWRRTEQALTRRSASCRAAETTAAAQRARALTEVPGASGLREPATGRAPRPSEVAWRNREASLDVASLEPYSRSRRPTSSTSSSCRRGTSRPSSATWTHLAPAPRGRRQRLDPAQPGTIRWRCCRGPARKSLVRGVLQSRGSMRRRSRRSASGTRELIETALHYEGRYYLRTSCTPPARSSSGPSGGRAAAPAQGARRPRLAHNTLLAEVPLNRSPRRAARIRRTRSDATTMPRSRRTVVRRHFGAGAGRAPWAHRDPPLRGRRHHPCAPASNRRSCSAWSRRGARRAGGWPTRPAGAGNASESCRR